MADKYLDTMNKETEAIEFISHELKSLADAFGITGNIPLGKRLYSMHHDLMESMESINKAVSKQINDRYNDSVQSSANMVNACIAMSTKELG